MFFLASTESPEYNLPSVSGVSKAHKSELSTDADEPEASKKRFDIHNLKWTRISIADTINFMEEYSNSLIDKELYEEKYITFTNHFEVLKFGIKDKFLIKKRETDSDPIVRVVEAKEYFDILNKAYIQTEHVNNCDEMKQLILEKQHWIPLPVINLFCKLHENCQKLKNISIDTDRRKAVKLVSKKLFEVALDKMYRTHENKKQFEGEMANTEWMNKTTKSIDEPVGSVSKEQFEDELNKILFNIKLNNKYIENAIKLIEEYEQIKKTNKRAYVEKHFQCVRKYEVLKIGKNKYLIKRRKTAFDPIVRVIAAKEYYAILNKAHIETKHGDSTEIKLLIERQYWIPKPIIELFCKLCNTCQDLQSNYINFSEVFADRGRIEFIDMKNNPDGEYAWVLHYQDLKTNFSILRPLASKDVDEITTELLKIVLQYGCPSILEPEHDQDREFVSELIKKLEGHSPDCKILIGKPGPYTSKIKHTPIDEMLKKWMSKNNSENWSKGILFVQFIRNTVRINKNSFFQNGSQFQVSPFTSIFKQCERLKLTMSMVDNLPDEVKTEEEYEEFTQIENEPMDDE